MNVRKFQTAIITIQMLSHGRRQNLCINTFIGPSNRIDINDWDCKHFIHNGDNSDIFYSVGQLLSSLCACELANIDQKQNPAAKFLRKLDQTSSTTKIIASSTGEASTYNRSRLSIQHSSRA